MQHASWIQRVGAYLVSALALAAIQGLGLGASLLLGERNWLTGVLLAGAFVFWIADRWVFSGRTGQTLGRRVLGIRMVDAGNGEPIGVWLAFVRDMWHVLDAVPCYLGFFAPLWDAERQTFADKIVKTVVVKT
ncbi:MAG: hypothetical protein QOD41_3028 [Cryptosporangiaceae bacterium]|nr:hypothetical protein [Cryptosporangiaceae bacterium]